MDVGGLSLLSCVCCRRGCHGDIQSPNLLEMVSIGFCFCFFFLIQLLCLLLCRDLGRMKSLLSLLLPFFQTKFSFCHLYHKSFFFICSRWSVTDLAKVLPLISIKCLYTYRPGQNSTFGSIDSVICSLTMLLLYICFRVCLVSGPFYTFLFQNIYLNAHGFFFFHRNFRIYVELL